MFLLFVLSFGGFPTRHGQSQKEVLVSARLTVQGRRACDGMCSNVDPHSSCSVTLSAPVFHLERKGSRTFTAQSSSKIRFVCGMAASLADRHRLSTFSTQHEQPEHLPTWLPKSSHPPKKARLPLARLVATEILLGSFRLVSEACLQ